MTRRVYVSEIEGETVRGRPPVKWRDRVQEYYVRERGEGTLRNLEQARWVCQDRERWKEKKKKSCHRTFFFFRTIFFLVKKVTIIASLLTKVTKIPIYM